MKELEHMDLERERVRVSHRPSVGIEESDPAITGSPVKICARPRRSEKKGIAVETGVKTVVAQCRGSGGASRHWLRPSVRSE